MNILGIDHGTKRIGLATARGGVKIAYPLKTIANDEHTLHELKNVLESENIAVIVLGLPRNLSAQDTQQTALVRTFAVELESLGVTVVFQDETSSSDRATERGAAKSDRDAWAAALILQDYLDQ